MMQKKLFWILAFFVLLNIAFAVPPFQSTSIVQSTGLTIEQPIFDVVPINSNFTFYWQVYNESGILMTNSSVSCLMHIYDPRNGSHILMQNGFTDLNGIDFKVQIPNSLFTREGNYFQLIQCNTSSKGGFLSHNFKVGYNLSEGSVQEAIIYAMIIIVLSIFFILSIVTGFMINGENEFNFAGDLVKINLNKYLKVFLFFLAYIFFWGLTFVLWEVSAIFFNSADLTGILHVLFIIETILMVPAFMVIPVVLLVKHIADSQLLELTKRGLKPR